MEKLKAVFTNIPKIFSNFSLASAVEIILIFLVVFTILNLLSKSNAKVMIIVSSFYILAMSIICVELEVEPILYLLMLSVLVICIVGIFANDIKRELWSKRTGKSQMFEGHSADKNTVQAVNNNINEIVKALQNMSKNDIGAIIVLSNTKVPDNILNSGVKIDATISSALIESVFFPKTPLHDGAMIIQGNKILSAGCFLPLSQETDLPKDLGTRHRAGIGITEILNATSIIVSEETGIISYAVAGKITRYADSEMLRKVLKDFYWQDLFGQK